MIEYTIQASVGNLTVPFVMPSENDFNMMDGNGTADGVLTMDEWVQFVGCVDQ